jgi:hypothetical protein
MQAQPSFGRMKPLETERIARSASGEDLADIANPHKRPALSGEEKETPA